MTTILTQRKKKNQKWNRDRSDGCPDSDDLVKHNKPKMKCRGRISESENESEDGKDNDDLSDETLNENSMTDNWNQGKITNVIPKRMQTWVRRKKEEETN